MTPPYPDAHLHDTHGEAWRDICLARWICRLDGAEARAAWLARMKARHGAILADHFAELVRVQWRTRRDWARARAAEPEPDLFATA